MTISQTAHAEPRVSRGADLLEFAIGGMTCGACAVRIERQLNRLDGVAASVSYATERAYVTNSGGREPADFISVIEAVGYTAELAADVAAAGDGGRLALPGSAQVSGTRLKICGPLAAATVILAMVPAAQFPGWQWLSLALAGPVAVWGAWPMHRVAWLGLGHATATMDTLVSLGVTASFGWSVYALLFGGAGQVGMRMSFALTFGLASGHMVYFEAAAGVTVAVLAGRYLEARAKKLSGAALTVLAGLGAKTVAVLRDGSECRVPIESLAVGEQFVVRPGGKIATDGLVVRGQSAVDASMVTGESIPVDVGPGAEVTGATVNMTGLLVIRATRVGADTRLAQITALVNQALASKARAQRLADRVAAVFVPCVISLAAATFGFWLGIGLPAADACSAGVAVLVVACPCALGLATPTALLAALGRGAELGILLKSAQSLETAGRVSALVLDKTGTLTAGAMTVRVITTDHGTHEREALRLAGALEIASEHPVGRAIAAEAAARLTELPDVHEFASLPGGGVQGTVDGRWVIAGSPDFLAGARMLVSGELSRAVESAQDAGLTAVLVGWDSRVRAVFAVGDEIRQGSVQALARLRRMGLLIIVLTGDNQRAAHAVAEQLAIPADAVFAGFQPDEKARAVRELQGSGYSVAMVGDGVNDAAALAQADLGMAVGTGAEAAIGAADVTLVSGEPGTIADAVELARVTLAIIRLNLMWAFGYNAIAIPLAALGYLNPLFAGFAMSASSLVVVSNSLLLRRFRPRRLAAGPRR